VIRPGIAPNATQCRNRQMNKNLSRRKFIQLTSALAAAPAFSPLLANAKEAQVAISNMIVINALGGISNQNVWAQNQGKTNGSVGKASISRIRSIDARAIRDTHASGTTAINATLGYVAGPEDPYESTIDDIAEWNSIVHRHPEDLIKVWNADDIVRAKQQNKIGIIFGFQNAASVGDKPERIKTFADLGVRIIQLTYNDANQIGNGSVVPEDNGLSAFGYEVVEALNENKVLVDLSHSGNQTCLDALKASKSPIAITHTGCRAITDVPRNKTDEEMRLVAEKGGVVGIYFMPFLRLDGQAHASDVVQHIEHAINVCGEDHVGIGTDGSATTVDDMTSYRAAINIEVQQRRKGGVSAKGETNQVVPLIPDLMGPEQFRKLAGLLSQRGYSSARIEKILGANFLRLMRDVWPA
jgi:membrane dipeptidase